MEAVERCAARPAHALYPLVHKRLQTLHHHMLAVKQLRVTLAPVVPLMIPYLNRAFCLSGTLLTSNNVACVLLEIGKCYSRALNRALDVLYDYQEFGLNTDSIVSAVESLQLLIQHHNMFVQMCA